MKSLSFLLAMFLSSNCFGQTTHNNTVIIHNVSVGESLKRLSIILVQHYHYQVLDTSTYGGSATLTMNNGYNTAVLYFDTTGNGANTLLSDNFKEDKDEKAFLQEFAIHIENDDDKMQPFQSINGNQETEAEILRSIQSSVSVIEAITVGEAVLAVLGIIIVVVDAR
jgi:hypothetical protein